MATLYVNPQTGSDAAAGSQSAPFKTIARAISRAASGTVIQLAAGTYSAASGEQFPLEIPSGVKVIGNEANKGSGTLIQGSGKFVSPTAASQNITLLLATDAELRGVTVTNLDIRGTGVWMESTSPTVANCTFTLCKREGVFFTYFFLLFFKAFKYSRYFGVSGSFFTLMRYQNSQFLIR